MPRKLLLIVALFAVVIAGSAQIERSRATLQNPSILGSLGLSTARTLLVSTTAPTIGSGFGTSPSVASSNGTATFRVNVGTGGVATTGVITMPAAATGWNCQVTDFTNNTVTRETASTTTSVTVTAAAAWAASDVLIYNCMGF